jgi:S-adenosylmethionine uptake transporter
MSGVLAALAYLQVTALGRTGEPDYRIVFYFSLCGSVAGFGIALFAGFGAHTPLGLALLLAIGLLATTAQLMMTRAYAIGRTLSNAALQYSGIAFSFAFGALVFDDAVTAMAIAGILLIVVAGLAATLLRARSSPAAGAPTDAA